MQKKFSKMELKKMIVSIYLCVFGSTGRIGDVMVSVLASRALRRRNKDWFARNQNNVSVWSDMSILGLLFQWASTMQNTTQRVGLVQSGPHYHLIEN